MKVLFDTRRIQKLGRVSLSEQLLRNAGLQEGDQVDIFSMQLQNALLLSQQLRATTKLLR
ncbi:hypothetical protein PSYPI_22827, partial [Pseudomonas syringae pv. pisi str. 1704B]